MRLSALFIRLLVFVVAGIACLASARAITAVVENRSVLAVQETLVDSGYGWASVIGDGLQVILEGDAPSEAIRFRAISAAGTVVDASRVIDNLRVTDSVLVAPPTFAIEMMRNDAGVTLIGLIPAETDRARLASRIRRSVGNQTISDLLDVADYAAPQHWSDAVDFAVRAMGEMPKSKISVSGDRISVIGIADSLADKRRLETLLSRQAPDALGLAIDISSPRQVVTPFTVRFALEDGTARFDACVADTAEVVSEILRAATSVGFQGQLDCGLAIGAPSRTWGTAVAGAINALGTLGGGTITFSDTDVTLIAPIGTDQSLFDNTVGALENALPDAFALSATLLTEETVTEAVTPEFTATLSPEGLAHLRGRLPDEMSNTVVRNFAEAKFGSQNVAISTRISAGLPPRWPLRVLAALEALSALSNGFVEVTENSFVVRGKTGSLSARGDITRNLIDELGQGAKFTVDVEYVEALDPIAAIPTPQECLARILAVTRATKITFLFYLLPVLLVERR